jgi:hypothetical protein
MHHVSSSSEEVDATLRRLEEMSRRDDALAASAEVDFVSWQRRQAWARGARRRQRIWRLTVAVALLVVAVALWFVR